MDSDLKGVMITMTVCFFIIVSSITTCVMKANQYCKDITIAAIENGYQGSRGCMIKK